MTRHEKHEEVLRDIANVREKLKIGVSTLDRLGVMVRLASLYACLDVVDLIQILVEHESGSKVRHLPPPGPSLQSRKDRIA